MTTQQPGHDDDRNGATRRGVLKAGLAAGALAGTGAWRFAPSHAAPGSLPGLRPGSPAEAHLEPAGMTPYSVAGTTLTSGASQYTVPVTASVPGGDGLVVAIALGGSNPPTVTAVTDSQGNTYVPLQQGSPNSPDLAVFSPAAPYIPGTPLPPYSFKPLTANTDTFTITLLNAAPGGGCVIAYGIPGQPVVDVSVLTGGTGTTPSVAGTPRQAGETALAIFAWANGGGAGTVGSPFTQLAQEHATNGAYLTVADDSSPAVSSALTASYTLAQSVSWYGVLLTFSTGYAGAYQASSTSGVKGNTTYSIPIQAGSPLAPAGLPALPAGDGAALVVALGGTSPPAVSSVTDSQGNTWTQQVLTETGSPQLYVFTAGTATAPGIQTGLKDGSSPDTLTVTFQSATTSAPAFLLIGASMRPAVDLGVSTYATGTSTSPSVTGTPANGCEVVLGLFAWANGGGTGTPAAPFTQIGQAQGGTGSYATAYYYGQALADSAQTASATITSATWRGVMLSFQVAALNWFANYAEINEMYAVDNDSCADLYAASTSMSIIQDPTSNPTSTSSNPPAPGSLPSGFSTTPILKYSSYEQLATDLANPSQNPNLAQFKWLEYDTEHWPWPTGGGVNTEPPEEEQNPWSYLRQFVTLAHENGFRVMLAPALDLAMVSNTLVPPTNGETNGDWTQRTGILAACAAAGADIVHCQCQSDQPPSQNVSVFQGLFRDLYTQAQAQSAYCLITAGLRSNSPATDTDIKSAYTSVIPPQSPPAPTAQGFWMNVGSGSAGTAAMFNEDITQNI